MLQAAELPLPERVWAHGFVLLGGERFSKSAGVRLDLDEAIERFGADAFRYFLLREVPFDADGSFSWERFEERYNADLANALGNLASRAISMVERYCGGVVPGGAAAHRRSSTRGCRGPRRSTTRRWTARAAFCLHEALRHVWQHAWRAATSTSTRRRRGSWRRIRPARRAREHARGARATARAPGDAICAVHAREGPGAVASLGAPGKHRPIPAFAALDKLDPTGWKVAKGLIPLFPKAEPPKPAG